MTINQRFSVNENNKVIDSLAPANTFQRYASYKSEDDMHLREDVVFRRLSCLVDDLIVNTNPMAKLPTDEDYQPFCEERHAISGALYQAIEASHHTLDV